MLSSFTQGIVDLNTTAGPVEFNWKDALNLESCLTEEEIMMRCVFSIKGGRKVRFEKEPVYLVYAYCPWYMCIRA